MAKSDYQILTEAIQTALLPESDKMDFECRDCDAKGHRSTDSNTAREHRDARYKEYLGLKSLSFHNDQQAKRFQKLKELRKRDNIEAFKERHYKNLSESETPAPLNDDDVETIAGHMVRMDKHHKNPELTNKELMSGGVHPSHVEQVRKALPAVKKKWKAILDYRRSLPKPE